VAFDPKNRIHIGMPELKQRKIVINKNEIKPFKSIKIWEKNKRKRK